MLQQSTTIKIYLVYYQEAHNYGDVYLYYIILYIEIAVT